MTRSITVGCDRLADRRTRPDGRSRRFHRKPTGSAALWSLGGHATLPGWTPVIPSQYRALIPLAPHGGSSGRATRAVLALVAAVRVPLRLRLDAGHRPGCPPAFSGLGAGRCPRCAIGVWALLFPLRAGICLRLPRSAPTPWAGCGLLGCGWTPGPTSCGVAPNFLSLLGPCVYRALAGSARQIAGNRTGFRH